MLFLYFSLVHMKGAIVLSPLSSFLKIFQQKLDGQSAYYLTEHGQMGNLLIWRQQIKKLQNMHFVTMRNMHLTIGRDMSSATTNKSKNCCSY